MIPSILRGGLVCLIAAPAFCDIVTISPTLTAFTDQSNFLAATGAHTVNLGTTDLRSSGSLNFGEFTVSAPHAINTTFGGGSWNIVYDALPLTYSSPTNPATPLPGLITGNGEDDLLFQFTSPVYAISLAWVTNFTGNNSFIIRDLGGAILYDGAPGTYAPNSLNFVGFHSSVQIGSFYMESINGGIQNQGVYQVQLGNTALEVPEAVPEPGTLALFGLGLSGLAVFLRRSRKP